VLRLLGEEELDLEAQLPVGRVLRPVGIVEALQLRGGESVEDGSTELSASISECHPREFFF
jgi:hypothetical protein